MAPHPSQTASSSATAPTTGMLWGVGTAAAAACGAAIALAATNAELFRPALRATLLLWVAVPFLVGGLIAWRRRPDSRFGPLMIVVGFVVLLAALQWGTLPALNTLGQLCDLLTVAVILHAFLAYPTGRLPNRVDRALVLIGYGLALGGQLLVLALGGFDPHHLLTVVVRPDLAEAVQNAELLGLAALCLAGVVRVWSRRAHLPAAQSRRPTQLLIDSFALSLIMLAALLVAGTFALPGFEMMRLATFGVLGLTPLAFLAGLLDARLARASVGDLLVRLRADPAPNLPDLLRRALRDPSLAVLYWLPQYDSWSDPQGNAADLPEPGGGRAVRVIERHGEPLAALAYDPSLDDEPELLNSVSAAAEMALENGRLEAELRARLVELHGSRIRVIEAEQNERRRLERNLHDGAQQRLVALALELGLLSERLGSDVEVGPRLRRARGEVARSLDELRDVARGIHPAVVSAHGLAVALESVAATSPVPVELSIGGLPRLSEPIAVAAYYVVCECLTNAAKHASASLVRVGATIVDGGLVVSVSDDGLGGADPERGSGLRGLADRVEALDGRLRVWSPASGGTQVRAEIPCG